MERNTVLAIVLSILVLFTYEAIFVAPKRAQMLKTSQLIVNKEIKTEIEAKPIIAHENIVETTNIAKKEEIYILKSTNQEIKYSNVGASLHKVDFPTEKKEMPLAGVFNVSGFENAEFSVTKANEHTASFLYTNKNWQITKKIELQDQYLTKVRLEIKNVSEMSNLTNFAFTAIGIDATRLDNSNNRETMLDEYSIYAAKKVFRKGGAFKFNAKENKKELGNVQWAGFRDHYMAVVVKPEFETKSYEITSVADNKLNILIRPQEKALAPGETAVYEWTMFAGPQDAHLMKKYGKEFEKVVAFSNFFLIDWIAQAIYWTIPFLQSIFKSWGVAIILISMLIYGLTYPLTIKSMMSMRKMQQMQPKIAALRERYKNDPQKLNTETVEIYRREKINPMGGCLPFLLQMPIFIALYQVLWRSFYFQGKSFLWIKDLSQADRLFILPFNLPFLGNEFNILPILMAVVMFAQQKLSAKNTVAMDETQAMQQKMMTVFFPFFIGFIFYKFASCLSLYFTMFYLFSTLTQWKMSKIK